MTRKENQVSADDELVKTLRYRSHIGTGEISLTQTEGRKEVKGFLERKSNAQVFYQNVQTTANDKI